MRILFRRIVTHVCLPVRVRTVPGWAAVLFAACDCCKCGLVGGIAYRLRRLRVWFGRRYCLPLAMVAGVVWSANRRSWQLATVVLLVSIVLPVLLPPRFCRPVSIGTAGGNLRLRHAGAHASDRPRTWRIGRIGSAWFGLQTSVSPRKNTPISLQTSVCTQGERVARERAARMGANLCRRTRRNSGINMPPPRPESDTKTPEVFSGVKRPEGEHWRRERSRRAADASAGALILKDKLTTTIFTCRHRNGGVRGGTRRGVPLRTARPSAVPRGIQRRGVLRYCRST